MQEAISFEATAIAQFIYQNNTSVIKERPQETSCFSIILDTQQNKNCSKVMSRHGTELWMSDFLIILFFGPSVMLSTTSKKWQIFRPICVLMRFDHICCLPSNVVFHWRSPSIKGRLQSKVSSIKGRLPSEVVFHWRLSSIGGCLPLEVVFPWRSSSLEGLFPWRSFSIKGCLPSKVVFHWRLSSIEGCLQSKVVSHLRGYTIIWQHQMCSRLH